MLFILQSHGKKEWHVVKVMSNYTKTELTGNITSHLYCKFVSIFGKQLLVFIFRASHVNVDLIIIIIIINEFHRDASLTKTSGPLQGCSGITMRVDMSMCVRACVCVIQGMFVAVIFCFANTEV